MELSKQDLADILKSQISKALRRFEEGHNKTHKTIYVELDLLEGTWERPNQSTYYTIQLSMKANGIGTMLFRRAFNDIDARAGIYQELLYELIGRGIIFNLINNEVSITTDSNNQSTTELQPSSAGESGAENS